MAVVWCEYQPQKASGSGSFRESPVILETWLVRVDAPPPTTSVQAIVTAPNVGYGTAHPTFIACKAMRWNYSAADQTGLLWTVTVEYFVPLIEVDPTSGLPVDIWSGRGVNVSVPFFRDKDNAILKNSAGDPIEGMERDLCFPGWTLTRAHLTLTAASSEINAVVNRTNSAAWPSTNSGAAETWKCSLANLQKQVIVTQTSTTQTAVRYWEVTYEMEYREETWKLKPWDMGFNERCDSDGVASGAGTKRRVILGVDGRPVRQPVALSNGVSLPPGTPPVALEFTPYQTANFSTYFGNPA